MTLSEKRLESSEEVTVSILRSMITDVYYRHRAERKIPDYERQNLHHMYEDYTNRGGNSYIHELMEHMSEWETE